MQCGAATVQIVGLGGIRPAVDAEALVVEPDKLLGEEGPVVQYGFPSADDDVSAQFPHALLGNAVMTGLLPF